MADIQTAEGSEGEIEAARAAIVAEQNDRFRSGWGADFTVPGRIVMTRGVAALPHEAQLQLMAKVMQFSEFTEDNDPWGIRDFGIVTVRAGDREVRVYWKIDLYDTAYEYGSDDAADITKTRRLLTLLLPEEY